jgi:hypothetical protein
LSSSLNPIHLVVKLRPRESIELKMRWQIILLRQIQNQFGDVLRMWCECNHFGADGN